MAGIIEHETYEGSKDIGGKTFGRWTVLHVVGYRLVISKGKRQRHWYWLCRCECGTEKMVSQSNLQRGDSQSCGCLLIEWNKATHTTHGLEGTRVYSIWHSMQNRCRCPDEVTDQYYKARGIKACERWGRFEAFLEDMGQPPTDKHSLDRIDPNLGYYKENCRWATSKEQQRNRRDNQFLELDGVRKLLIVWSEELGINLATLKARIRSGWSDKDALTIPVFTRRKIHGIS